jgi:hypothetical protein
MCLRRFGELGIDFDPAAFGSVLGSAVAAWSGR